MSYNIQKLVRSKIQKCLNVSLANATISNQIKDSATTNKDSAVFDIKSIFQKEFKDAQIDKKLQELKKNILKRRRNLKKILPRK